MGDDKSKAATDQTTAKKPEQVVPDGTSPESAEKTDKDPEIEIKQVPMDGICGGY